MVRYDKKAHIATGFPNTNPPRPPVPEVPHQTKPIPLEDIASESVAGIDRNQWPLSIGIDGRLG